MAFIVEFFCCSSYFVCLGFHMWRLLSSFSVAVLTLCVWDFICGVYCRVFLLQFLLCVSGISYVAFIVTLYVHLSFFWCLDRVVRRDCGISWVSLLVLSFSKGNGCARNYRKYFPCET